MELCFTTLLRVAFRASCSLWSSWISTASAVRYYTEIQSCLTAAVFPSILSAISLCLLMRLCSGGDPKSTRHSLLLLIDCTARCSCSDRISLSIEHSRLSLVEFILLSCMELRPIDWTGSKRFRCIIFSVVDLHYHRLWGFRVSSSRSIGLISIMLVGHLTLISYTN